MKKLEFKTEINAKPEKVWNTMLEPDSFREWTNAGSPGTYYEGKWKEGTDIRFLSGEQQGGTLAHLEVIRKPEYIKARHVAVITGDGKEDRTSDQAKGWIGTTEEYTFTEKNGKTELTITVNTTPEWESMFTGSWPKLLKKLKEIAERKTTTV